ncbi:MAG: small multidrug efflux protein [Dermatophilaceae bacterium]
MPSIYDSLQDLAEQVPALLQPLIVALAGMIPYVEGEGSAALGVVAGLNPVVAGVAGAVGNFLSVLLVVTLGARARAAVVARRAGRSTSAPVHAVTAGGSGTGGTGTAVLERPDEPGKPRSRGRRRLERWLVRFGVPGASLLAPLALPTQLTAAAFVAAGVGRARVLVWQAVAIVLWTGAVTLAATGAMRVLAT